MVSSTTRAGQQVGMEYDPYDNLIRYRKPGRPKEDKYQLKYDSSAAEKKQHLLREMRTPIDMVSTTTYDK